MRRTTPIFCAVAAVLLLALFRDAWLHGHVLGQGDFLFGQLPWSSIRPVGWRIGNPLLGDVPLVFYPFALKAREAVLHGTFPLWSTAVGAGEPLFASFQSAVLSPFALLLYTLPFPASLTPIAAARLFVGGLGMFLFLRRLPLSSAASFFGGVAYLLNPFSVVWLEHPLSAVAAWLPWLLLAVDTCDRAPSGRAVAGTALATACTLLSGHPETAFELVLIAGAYAFFRGVTSGRWVRTPALVLAGGTLGLLLSAVQVLPFAEYVQGSRIMAARSTAIEPHFTNPPVSFVTTFVPDFFGTPLGPRFVIGGNYCEQVVYAGIATWAFASAALFSRTERKTAMFFAAAALTAGLIMYGTPVAKAAVFALPPLRLAALSRFGLLVIAAVAVCGAIGVDALIGGSSSRRLRWAPIAVTAAAVVMAAVVYAFFQAQEPLLTSTRQWTRAVRGAQWFAQLLAAAVALAWLTPRLPKAAAGVVMTALIALDLFVFADGFHPMIPREYSYPNVPELELLQQDRSVFRVAAMGNNLLPNTVIPYGLADIRVYDGVIVGRYSQLLDTAMVFNGSRHLLANVASPSLMNLLNLKYVLAPQDTDLPRDRFTLIKDGATRVFRNDRVQPRAFLADDAVVLDGQPALRAIRDGGVDLTRQAIVETTIDPGHRPERARGADVASILTYHDDYVRIETNADGRRLLVLTDVFYPGWRAMVDGAAAPIVRADYAFRGVPVPAGRHLVEFRYVPGSLRLGLTLSVLALVALAVASRYPYVQKTSR